MYSLSLWLESSFFISCVNCSGDRDKSLFPFFSFSLSGLSVSELVNSPLEDVWEWTLEGDKLKGRSLQESASNSRSLFASKKNQNWRFRKNKTVIFFACCTLQVVRKLSLITLRGSLVHYLGSVMYILLNYYALIQWKKTAHQQTQQPTWPWGQSLSKCTRDPDSKFVSTRQQSTTRVIIDSLRHELIKTD